MHEIKINNCIAWVISFKSSTCVFRKLRKHVARLPNEQMRTPMAQKDSLVREATDFSVAMLHQTLLNIANRDICEPWCPWSGVKKITWDNTPHVFGSVHRASSVCVQLKDGISMLKALHAESKTGKPKSMRWQLWWNVAQAVRRGFWSFHGFLLNSGPPKKHYQQGALRTFWHYPRRCTVVVVVNGEAERRCWGPTEGQRLLQNKI